MVYNEVDLARYTCYALGMLLGFDEHVCHPRFDRNPSLVAVDSDQAQEIRISVQSLDNFQNSVSNLLNMSLGLRSIIWDLDLGGKHEIASVSFGQEESSTFFELFDTSDRKELWILGSIEIGFS